MYINCRLLFSQLIENGDVKEEYQKMFDRKYDITQGPLWAGRLVRCSDAHPKSRFAKESQVFDVEDDIQFEDESQVPGEDFQTAMDSNYLDKKLNKHRFRYHLIFGCHHIAADGYTIMRLYGIFMKMINDILDKKNLDFQTQNFSLVDIRKEMELMREIKENVENNPSQWKKVMQSYENFISKKTSFLEAHPIPDPGPWTTSNLTHHLSENTTKQFLKRCKHEGITFLSGFSYLTCLATKEMCFKAGIGNDSFEISHTHVLDHRRYNDNGPNPFGTNTGYLNITSVLSSDNSHSFWSAARIYNSNFRKNIDNHQSIRNDVFRQLFRPANFDVDLQFIHPVQPWSYFTTSNMLDVTPVLGNIGDNVRVEWLHGGTSNHRSSLLVVHICHTLRGRLQYGINYSSQYVSSSTARSLAQTIFRLMHKVIRI